MLKEGVNLLFLMLCSPSIRPSARNALLQALAVAKGPRCTEINHEQNYRKLPKRDRITIFERERSKND